MAFMQWIINRLVDISEFFYDLMLEVWDWPVFGYPVGLLFYSIHSIFANLAWDFVDFDDWLEWALDEIRDILSWGNIQSLIRGWLDGIEDLINWFADWWYWIRQEVDQWWSAVSVTVLGLIDIAVQGLSDLREAWDNFWNVLLPAINSQLQLFTANWVNFWVNIFPTLVSFTWLETWWNDRLLEVDSLIDSTLRDWFPFYDDLVGLWDDIKAFFTDPLQWAYDKLDEWFERFW